MNTSGGVTPLLPFDDSLPSFFASVRPDVLSFLSSFLPVVTAAATADVVALSSLPPSLFHHREGKEEAGRWPLLPGTHTIAVGVPTCSTLHDDYIIHHYISTNEHKYVLNA